MVKVPLVPLCVVLCLLGALTGEGPTIRLLWAGLDGGPVGYKQWIATVDQ